METLKVELQVAKETYELGEGVSKFVAACKGALDDGWNFGDDLPVVIQSALMDLLPAIQGAEKLVDEFKTDKEAFTNAALASFGKIPFLFIKQQEPNE